ncbi:hypothetical protein ABH943_001596 [Caballeronia udeis]|uniref:Uncharacterized protein n=1 Tax=Caballeronia udeis TaxID=1232866 RepID=A0ABW8MGK4_9BURK
MPLLRRDYSERCNLEWDAVGHARSANPVQRNKPLDMRTEHG